MALALLPSVTRQRPDQEQFTIGPFATTVTDPAQLAVYVPAAHAPMGRVERSGRAA